MIPYWAKTIANDKPGITVSDHMLNVGYVARLIALQKPSLLTLLGLDPNEIAALAGTHDVGKISQGFQQKCPAWLQQNGLFERARVEAWDHCETDHSKISQFSLQNYLRAQAMSSWSAALWAAAIGGHHGRLHKVEERGLALAAGMQKDAWEVERQKALQVVVETFGLLPKNEIDQDSAALWWLAGLTSVADWIGSDERFFPADSQVAHPGFAAETALQDIGFLSPKILPRLDFKDLFGFNEPNSLQRASHDFITSPGLYVIEAPMGMGKTEAALWCAYRLLSDGEASGIYFALPTQATSNRIHLRMSDFINRITDDNVYTRLVHSNSWLMQDLSMPQSRLVTDQGSEKGPAIVRDWFASRKRALLAPFGVGTVDQALLGIVAARHFFVRRFALAGKVIIVDEVHSYDVYTGTLVKILCQEMLKLGCTVILLSATLTRDRCGELFGESAASETEAYPLLSGRKREDEHVTTCSIPSLKENLTSVKVNVQFKAQEEVIDRAANTAKSGGYVLWICNTVAAAQAAFEQLNGLAIRDQFDIGLLHSRFPFYRREVLENEWMGRFGKGERIKKGCILVATQVVEQSVDLDADLMISELAPTDMLLQRLGRLWRHKRQCRAIESPLLAIVKEKDSLEFLRKASAAEIKKILGAKALVYSPYILLRSWEVWRKKSSISLPADIRSMLRETYADRTEEAEGWIKLANDWFGNDYARKQRADWETNVFQILLEDTEGVNTRLNERPTANLVLARTMNSTGAVLLDGSSVTKNEERFDMKTAKALNRNVVRVPHSALIKNGRLPEHPLPAKYITGEAYWAIVQDDVIEVPKVQTEKMLSYSDLIGVKITKRGAR